jgi:hypothetical protein
MKEMSDKKKNILGFLGAVMLGNTPMPLKPEEPGKKLLDSFMIPSKESILDSLKYTNYSESKHNKARKDKFFAKQRKKKRK